MSQEFRDAVRERSRVEGDLIIVDTSVNHMVDPALMRSCGEWLARELGQADLVVTSEASTLCKLLAEKGLEVRGLGFAIEKSWTGGRERLERSGHRVISPVTIDLNEEGARVVR